MAVAAGLVATDTLGDIRKARWLFGGYLALFSLMVVPIAAAGASLFGGTSVADDSYVLALPLAAPLAPLAGASAAGAASLLGWAPLRAARLPT